MNARKKSRNDPAARKKSTAPTLRAMTTNVQNVTRAPPTLPESPPNRPGHRPDDGPQSGEPGGRVLRELGGYENREASRVTYKGTKGYNTEVAHDPSVFAPGNGACSRGEACETFRLFIKPYAQIAESRMRGTQNKAAFCANTSGAALRLLNGLRQPVPVGLKA